MDLTSARPSDPMLAKVQLRKELSTSLRSQAGTPHVLIRDPLRSQYFRLGLGEWRIVQFFDGQRTLRQVVRDAATAFGADSVSPAEVHRLASWSVRAGLAECIEGDLASSSPNQRDSWQAALDKTARAGRWNPLFLKVGLPNPEPVLGRVFPYLNWIFSPYTFVIWLVICVAGGYCVLSQWERFRSALNDVFLGDNWIYLFVTWLVLKALHEVGHAVACLRHGGEVRRWGLMFILFSPIAWVDVTSAWSFRSKWTRILVSAAGMYVEFLIAGMAALIWGNTENALTAMLTRNIVVTASIGTLLFNLNFLMRFDGYYILSDLLEIQNLYSAGQHYVTYFLRRYVLGMNATPPRATGGELAIIRAYGFLSLVWRFVFCFGIVLAAARMFHGAGVVLALFSAAIWFGLPMLRCCILLVRGQGEERPNLTRFSLVAATMTLTIVGVLALPWPGATRAHAVVDFSPRQALRADSPGFVQRVLVRPGQEVQAGQVLLQLDNPELKRELADLDLQLRMNEISRRVMHRDHEMAQYVAAGQKLQSLREQREQLAGRIDALLVRAPISGTVIANDLESLTGSYIQPGVELLSVGALGKKELRVAIRQRDVESFRVSVRDAVTLLIPGHPVPGRTARLESVYPRATRRVLHSGLAATHGGPLAVTLEAGEDNDQGLQLLEPHFEGVVSIPRDLSSELRAGEICQVTLGRGHESIYARLCAFAREYLDRTQG